MLRDSKPILVVEDDEIHCRLTVRQLAQLGYQGQYVTSGKEAVERASKLSYGLILMDIYMSHMDGIEATKAIREHEQQTSSLHVPIVALTADLVVEREKCLASGMNEVIFKPTRLNELREVLERWLPEGKA